MMAPTCGPGINMVNSNESVSGSASVEGGGAPAKYTEAATAGLLSKACLGAGGIAEKTCLRKVMPGKVPNRGGYNGLNLRGDESQKKRARQKCEIAFERGDVRP